MGILELLFWPFLACLVLTGIHCYLGIHVVGRGVIFVDLAMAQIAFLGSAVTVAALSGWEAQENTQSAHPAAQTSQHHPSGQKPAMLARYDTTGTKARAASATASAAPFHTASAPQDRAGQSDSPVTEDAIEELIPPDTAETSPPAGSLVEQAGEPPQRAGLWKYLGGFLFTLVGAALFSLGRLRHRHVPQEAIIGIVYAVASALALILLYKAPHDVAEQTRDMLVGRVLFVDQPMVIKTAILYAAVGMIHFLARRPLLLISFAPEQAASEGLAVRWWDFLFYATFGIIVTSSVQMAGVLLVFSYLIVPAVCAMLFFDKIAHRLWFGWAMGFGGSVAGIALSVWWDAPTGASIVVAFGALLLVLLLLRSLATTLARLHSAS